MKHLPLRLENSLRSKVSPIDPRETLEIYAFMEAADESKRKGGITVKLDEVLKNAGYKR